MKNIIIPVSLALFISTPVIADKPEWAGKGKPSPEQLEELKDKHREKADERAEKDHEKAEKYKEKEMQRTEKDREKTEEYKEKEREFKKSEDDMKEKDVISDEAEEERKKWWQIW